MRRIIFALGIVVMLAGSAVAAEFDGDNQGRPFGWHLRDHDAALQLGGGDGAAGESGDAGAAAGATGSTGDSGNSGNSGNGEGEGCSR